MANTLAGLTAAMRRFDSEAKGAQRSLDRFNGSAAQLQRTLREIRSLSLAGGAMALVGGALLATTKAPLEAAKTYELAHARFKTLNLGEVLNREADAFARGADKFGASSTALMDALRESYGFFGNMKSATDAAGFIAELNAANANVFNGKIVSMDGGSVRSLMRFADMRGATNSPSEFRRTVELAQRLVTGSGGALQFRDLEQLAKTGGTAFKSLSDQGLLMLSSIMQEQGGSRTGTALMSLYQNLIAGRSTKQAMGVVSGLGLGEIVQDKIGEVGGRTQTRNIMRLNSDFAAMLRVDPAGALIRFVLPAIMKKNPGASDDVIAQAVNSMLSNRTASNLGVGVTTQMVQILRDASLSANSMGAQQTIDMSRRTFGGQWGNTLAKFNTLMTELGIHLLPAASRALEGLNTVLNGLLSMAKQFPRLTGATMELTAAIGVLAGAGGGLLLVKAGLTGLTTVIGAAGGVGLAGAIGGLIGAGGSIVLLTAAIGALGLAAKSVYDYMPTWLRPLTQAEIDKAKTDGGATLTPDAEGRIRSNPYGLFPHGPYPRNFRGGMGVVREDEGRRYPGQIDLSNSRRDRPWSPTVSGRVTPPPGGWRHQREMEYATTPVILRIKNHEVFAEIVSDELARELSRPSTGARQPNGSLQPKYPTHGNPGR